MAIHIERSENWQADQVPETENRYTADEYDREDTVSGQVTLTDTSFRILIFT